MCSRTCGGHLICFELFINGERIGRAGIPGFGVLNTILTEDKPFKRPFDVR